MRALPLSSGHRSWLLLTGAALGVVLTMSSTSAASPSSDGASTTITEKVDGFVKGYPGDCPDQLPPTPLVCHEWDITLYRNGTTAEPGGVAPPHSRWVLLALRHTLTFAGDGSEPVESDVGFGFVDGADVTFDREHLAYASVRAPGLALTDGTVVDLAAAWTAKSDRAVFGNDSPALDDFGLVRHFHDDCVTVVNQGHQKIRRARVQAVVNGTTTSNDGWDNLISTSQFTEIEVHPKSCS
jgi:hypothetical protein